MSGPQTAPRRDPTDFYDMGDLSALPVANSPADMPQPTSSEIWDAARVSAAPDREDARRQIIERMYAPVIPLLNKDKWFFQKFYNPSTNINLDQAEGAVWYAINERRKTDPKFLIELGRDREDMYAKQLERDKVARSTANATLSRSQGFIPGAIGFLGGGYEQSIAPVLAGDAPLSTGGLLLGGGGAKTLAQRIIYEGLANAGATAVLQPVIAGNRADIGEKLTIGEAATNVAGAFVFGAGVQGGVIEPFSALGRAAVTKIGARNLTPVERAAVTALDRDAEVEAVNPFKPGAGTEEYLPRLDKAGTALDDPATAAAIVKPPVARQPTGAMAREAVKARIGRVENASGSNTARNPLSSAEGKYQFTDGTWARLYQRRYGDGLSRADMLAKKADPAIQGRLMDDLLADNSAALAKIGAPETPGNLYLMHFAGQEGGGKILRAAPETPIERVLSADAIKANPFLRGKTAGEVAAWADRKMGGAGAVPTLRREAFDSDEDWARAQRDLEREDAALERVTDEQQAFDGAGSRRLEVGSDVPEGAIPIDAAPRAWDLEPGAAPTETPRVGEWPTAERAPPVEPMAPGTTRAELKSTVAADATDETMLSPIFVKPKGEPGFHIEDSHGDGHFLYATFRDAEGKAKAVVRYPATAEARAVDPVTGRSEYGDVISYVDPAYRRQGIATKLYDLLAKAGHDVDAVSGTSDLTPAGAAFVNARKRAASGAEPTVFPKQARDALPSVRDLGAADARNLSAAPTLSNEALKAFDDPMGSAANAMTASLEHDVRMMLEADPEAMMRLDDGQQNVRVADALDDVEKDHAALEAARRCMVPK